MTNTNKKLPFFISLVACFATFGCGTTDTALEAAFCDGLNRSAARTVAASSDAMTPPDVTDAARVDIMLNDTGGSFTGFVSYQPDEVGSFAFGFTQDVDIVVRDAAGQTVPVDVTVAGAETCEELVVRHSVSLAMETYSIEIVGGTDATLGLIAEESDDDR